MMAETHNKRMVTHHVCLPSLLDYEDKGILIVYSKETNIFTGPTRAAKQEQISLVPAWQDQQ
jgi:hypothetical protein